MSSLRIINLPDPYYSARRRHLVCRRHAEEGNLMVLANLASLEAAKAWIAERFETRRPASPKFLSRLTRVGVRSAR